MQSVSQQENAVKGGDLSPGDQESSLEVLISDLRDIRNGMISKGRRRRPAILIGQLALLASEYKNGRRPSRKRLRGFFYFVCREKAA
jgi:hypothetical protein